MRRPRIYFVGSSHCRRLFVAFKKSIRQDKYILIDLAQSGATFNRTVHTFPNPKEVFEDDIIIFQTFGNDLFAKHLNFVRSESSSSGREIHLEKFIPSSEESLDRIHEKLKNYIESIPAKCFLVDCIYRYLCQPECKSNLHFHPGILAFQSKHNKRLFEVFEGIPNCTVIKHIRCMPYTLKKLKKFRYYRFLLDDKVHLKEIYYIHIVKSFWQLLAEEREVREILSA